MSSCTHESGGFSWPAVLMRAEPAWKYRESLEQSRREPCPNESRRKSASPAGPRYERRRALAFLGDTEGKTASPLGRADLIAPNTLP